MLVTRQQSVPCVDSAGAAERLAQPREAGVGGGGSGQLIDGPPISDLRSAGGFTEGRWDSLKARQLYLLFIDLPLFFFISFLFFSSVFQIKARLFMFLVWDVQAWDPVLDGGLSFALSPALRRRLGGGSPLIKQGELAVGVPAGPASERRGHWAPRSQKVAPLHQTLAWNRSFHNKTSGSEQVSEIFHSE